MKQITANATLGILMWAVILAVLGGMQWAINHEVGLAHIYFFASLANILLILLRLVTTTSKEWGHYRILAAEVTPPMYIKWQFVGSLLYLTAVVGMCVAVIAVFTPNASILIIPGLLIATLASTIGIIFWVFMPDQASQSRWALFE